MARNRLPFVQRRKLADGTYRYRGWATFDGVRKWTEPYDTEQAAYDAALALRGAPSGHGSLERLAEIVVQTAREKRTEGTANWYRCHLDSCIRGLGGETWVHAITAARLDEWIKERLREVTAATVNADLRALHRAFAVAIRLGWADRNPVKEVDRPRHDTPPMDWFTPEELAAVLAKVESGTDRDLFALIALTGIRRAELSRLRPESIRLAQGQVNVAGKRRPRVVPVAPELRPVLERLLVAEILPPSLRDIDETFRRWRRKLQEPRLHAHALRHTFGTSLVRAGVALDVVMRLMGHRSIATTMRYVHESAPAALEAVGRLRLLPADETSRPAQG